MVWPQAPEHWAHWIKSCLHTTAGAIDSDRPDLQPLRAAAVLVGLVLHPDEPTILLTRRAAHLQAHPGQISFPGGAAEPHDQDAVATALRESQEEIGLDPDQVEVLGLLGEYHTSSRFSVTPVLGLLDPGMVLTPDPAEVDEIIQLPAQRLLDPSAYEKRWVERPGIRLQSHFIEHDGKLVWGATAGMLLALARRLGIPGEPQVRDDLTYCP